MGEKTALLVIDVQPGNVGKCYQGDEVVERIAGLVAKARAAGVPVVYIQDDDVGPEGDPAWAIDPRVAPLAGEPVVRKTATDAFHGTNLHEVLQGLGVARLVVAGARTEFCVDSACRRATTLGYNVLLVSDAHTTADSAVLPAIQVIAHANRVFSMLENLEHYSEVAVAAEVTF
ncbi:MAG TPA: cysteine hydrolase family protein [Symbiobacteriaceae bacterium]|nr:cysteine hydrolase family protein [Symbiobacteriaceae bacterium]